MSATLNDITGDSCRDCPAWIYYRLTTGQTAVGQSAATNLFQIVESCIIVVSQRGFPVRRGVFYFRLIDLHFRFYLSWRVKICF